MVKDLLEEAAIEILEELGYEHKFGPDIAFDGDMPERKDYKEVISPSLVENNRQFHKLLTEGIEVTFNIRRGY